MDGPESPSASFSSLPAAMQSQVKSAVYQGTRKAVVGWRLELAATYGIPAAALVWLVTAMTDGRVQTWGLALIVGLFTAVVAAGVALSALVLRSVGRHFGRSAEADPELVNRVRAELAAKSFAEFSLFLVGMRTKVFRDVLLDSAVSHAVERAGRPSVPDGQVLSADASIVSSWNAQFGDRRFATGGKAAGDTPGVSVRALLIALLGLVALFALYSAAAANGPYLAGQSRTVNFFVGFVCWWPLVVACVKVPMWPDNTPWQRRAIFATLVPIFAVLGSSGQLGRYGIIKAGWYELGSEAVRVSADARMVGLIVGGVFAAPTLLLIMAVKFVRSGR